MLSEKLSAFVLPGLSGLRSLTSQHPSSREKRVSHQSAGSPSPIWGRSDAFGSGVSQWVPPHCGGDQQPGHGWYAGKYLYELRFRRPNWRRGLRFVQANFTVKCQIETCEGSRMIFYRTFNPLTVYILDYIGFFFRATDIVFVCSKPYFLPSRRNINKTGQCTASLNGADNYNRRWCRPSPFLHQSASRVTTSVFAMGWAGPWAMGRTGPWAGLGLKFWNFNGLRAGLG